MGFVDRRLVLLLGIIISVLAVAFLFLADPPVDQEGWYVNLATEFIGILVTGVIVVLILDARERQSWKKAQKLVHSRFNRFTVGESADIGVLFSMGGLNLSSRLVFSEEHPQGALEVTTATEDQILEALKRLDVHELRSFQHNRRVSKERLSTLIDSFYVQLSSEVSTTVLELEDSLHLTDLWFDEIVPPHLFHGMSDDQILRQLWVQKQHMKGLGTTVIKSMLVLLNELYLETAN